MATYVTLINFTEHGARDVKETANRSSQYKHLAAQMGCMITDMWWLQGQYDAVAIVDAPDDAAASALAMSVGRLGYLRTQTMRAFSAAELATIMQKVV